MRQKHKRPTDFRQSTFSGLLPTEDLGHVPRPRPALQGRTFSSLPQSAQALCSCAPKRKRPVDFHQPTFLFWCPRRDSNPHTSRHMDLNHARLPIPPRGLRCKAKTVIIDSLKALSTTFSLPWHHFRCNTMPHPCFAPVLRLGKWPQLRYTRHIRPPGRASPWHL